MELRVWKGRARTGPAPLTAATGRPRKTPCLRALLAAVLLSSAACGEDQAEAGRAPEQAAAPDIAAPVPRAAWLERSGRLTLLEAPLPAPFVSLEGQWPKPGAAAARAPRLTRPAVPPELGRFIQAFPQAGSPTGEVLDLGSRHTIVLRDGCFVLDRDGADDPLVQFPFGTGLTVDPGGYLAFRSRYEGQEHTVRVGLPAETGWFTEPFAAPADLAARCGALTMVAVTTVSDPYAWPDRFLPSLRRYRDREGLSDDQTVARANACLQKQARISADRRLRASREGPPACRMLEG